MWLGAVLAWTRRSVPPEIPWLLIFFLLSQEHLLNLPRMPVCKQDELDNEAHNPVWGCVDHSFVNGFGVFSHELLGSLLPCHSPSGAQWHHRRPQSRSYRHQRTGALLRKLAQGDSAELRLASQSFCEWEKQDREVPWWPGTLWCFPSPWPDLATWREPRLGSGQTPSQPSANDSFQTSDQATLETGPLAQGELSRLMTPWAKASCPHPPLPQLLNHEQRNGDCYFKPLCLGWFAK